MSDIKPFLEAATRDNTRRSYQMAVEHYEATWGGHLPAAADQVAQYLAAYADTLSVTTLTQRLAALARWHQEQGFPDPTKAPVVKQVLKGIRALYPYQEKQAKPLQLSELEQVVAYLDSRIQQTSQHSAILPLYRNKALILLGFWRAFRSDELIRLNVESITLNPDHSLTLFLPRSKTDRTNQGQTYRVPSLSRLCPVNAYQDWITQAHLQVGPVFCGIDRWGNVSDKALHPNSIIPLLKKLLQQAGLAHSQTYSAHSLRRGFASWANTNHWDIKSLMQYVGWKHSNTALKYIDNNESLLEQRIETALARPANELKSLPNASEPENKTINEALLTVTLVIERQSKFTRGMKRTREKIEFHCLRPLQMKTLDKTRLHYQITMAYETLEDLNDQVETLLFDMHRLADDNHCFLEARIVQEETDQIWS